MTLSLLPLFALALLLLAGSEAAADLRIAGKVDVMPVWSGHPVDFALLTHRDQQYVAFYDGDRQMTIGQRTLADSTWRFVRLNDDGMRPGGTSTRTGWDSHNSIAMAIDSAGQLHISGNMHTAPLLYFRTEKPGDISTFRRIDRMTGKDENRSTYPRFLTGRSGELIFTYRTGSSGNGNQIYNVYDVASQAWSRLLDAPLTDGEGKANAYCFAPVAGPDGYYHMTWVWRDTPDCETNHDLSYARSRDLHGWEDSFGRPLKLPITMKTGEIVDPVPPGGGILNGNTQLGFDSSGRVIITYHKNDEAGFTQMYCARREADAWHIVKVSDWEYRWAFSGRGTINSEIGFSGVRLLSDGRLIVTWRHAKYGHGGWVLDEKTLRPVDAYIAPKMPAEWDRIESTFPGMQVRQVCDRGESGRAGVSYRLRWETLPANRDLARQGPLPAPTMLRVYELVEE